MSDRPNTIIPPERFHAIRRVDGEEIYDGVTLLTVDLGGDVWRVIEDIEAQSEREPDDSPTTYEVIRCEVVRIVQRSFGAAS